MAADRQKNGVKGFFSRFKEVDLLLWLPVLLLAVIGVLFIYSSSMNVEGSPHNPSAFPKYIKQIIWIVLGIVLAVSVNLIHWRDLTQYSLYVFPVFFIMLIIPLFMDPINGARSWIRFGAFSIQPAELMKPFYILVFSWLLIRFKDLISRPVPLILALAASLVPVLMILIQRDLGTASVYLPVLFLMLIRSGGNRRILMGLAIYSAGIYLLTLFAGWSKLTGTETFLNILITHKTARIIISLLLLIISMISVTGRLVFKKGYYFWICYFSSIFLAAYISSFLTVPTENGYGALQKFQIERIVYPVDNDVEVTSSYNIEQALTAIGSGGLTGKGFLQGNMSHRRFVPEQDTDFIFSILGEEWGLMGGMLVLILYAVLMIRILLIMTKVTDMTAQLILSGLFMMFFYHMTVNIGMNIGVIPVIGIPLMFISYGGTAVWTAFIGIGIIQNISRNS